jgi:predicted Rossmann-fold nucleotide-binding protein
LNRSTEEVLAKYIDEVIIDPGDEGIWQVVETLEERVDDFEAWARGIGYDG